MVLLRSIHSRASAGEAVDGHRERTHAFMSSDAIHLREAILAELADAYEDAGFRGLCDEGRWEAALGAVRARSPEQIVQRVNQSRTSSAHNHQAPMTEPWKPDGYNRVAPYLIVDGAQRTIDFLVRVFDAEKLRHFPADEGKIMHAEVRIGDSVLMIADGNEGWPPIGAHVHVYVPDADATYHRALEAGAETVQEPVRRDDEDRRGGFRDPGGTTWWVATRE